MKAFSITIRVFLVTATSALALREELFGNAPVPRQADWADGVG